MVSNQNNSPVVPAAFLRMLAKTAYFHDWYLKDMYVANTGKVIHEKSRKGFSTIQIEMCTSNNDIGYVLIFVDVKAFHVSMEYAPGDVSNCSFTSFGRCYQYCIEQHEQDQKHEFIFEGDAKISITCDRVKYRKVYNNFFV